MKILWIAPTLRWDLTWAGTFISLTCSEILKERGHDVTLIGATERSFLPPTMIQFMWEIEKKLGLLISFKKLLDNRSTDKLIKEINKINPDIIITLWSKSKLTKAKCDAKLVYWAINDPMDLSDSLNFAKNCDIVFTQSLGSVQIYKEHGIAAKWLPMACDPKIHYREKLPMERDIIFVGNYVPDRKLGYERLLYPLLKKGLYVEVYGVGWPKKSWYKGVADWNKLRYIYSSSKIALNIHREEARLCKLSVNMRVFEVLGCGGFLISDNFSGFEELFIPNKEIVVAEDSNELVELIQYYLENEDERQKIAQAGEKKVYSYHTYSHRMEEMFKVILRF